MSLKRLYNASPDTIILLCICAILASIECRPQPQFGLFAKTVPQVLKYNFQNFLRGFSFSVDTSDQFHHEARGELRSETGREEDEGIEVQGFYSYIGDDGKEYRVDYTAGKNGFEPAGTHLPPSAGVKKLGMAPSPCLLASIDGCGLG
ncbi:flexible cuticle protein 12-like [Anoplophora glabripennis]|uniref:flexible cuticle protein 12-like n=1 Tax=Anoplophora glabripennis TaxID=217634 RepID=UPI000874616B|nr:flexible cuticle protein 12-like [Anoplophora glabripennis]